MNTLWTDLTIPDAESVREFYEAVTGMASMPVSMGDYNDHCLIGPDGQPIAGVCHAKGVNQGIPPVWLVYLPVHNLDEALEATTRLGGEILTPIRHLGKDRMSVVKDPAGAISALYEKAATTE
jgi:hypothetical protein